MTSDTQNNVVQAIRNIKPEVEVGYDQNLISDGILDSFDLLMLVSEIEKITNIEIPGIEITPENFYSVSTISRLLLKLQQSNP